MRRRILTAFRSPRGRPNDQGERYRRKLESHLRQWRARRDELDMRANRCDADSIVEIEAQRRDLDAKMHAARRKLEELRSLEKRRRDRLGNRLLSALGAIARFHRR